jgi:hypothetical protein
MYWYILSASILCTMSYHVPVYYVQFTRRDNGPWDEMDIHPDNLNSFPFLSLG